MEPKERIADHVITPEMRAAVFEVLAKYDVRDTLQLDDLIVTEMLLAVLARMKRTA